MQVVPPRMLYLSHSLKRWTHSARTRDQSWGRSQWPTSTSLMPCLIWTNRSPKVTRKNGFGDIFLGYRNVMAKYELRLTGQSTRQTVLHTSETPSRTSTNALLVYIQEPCNARKLIPSVLHSLNAKMVESSEYEKIDVSDFMTDMSQNHRHRFTLKLHEGLSVPIFSY